jgi:hypothetical protein
MIYPHASLSLGKLLTIRRRRYIFALLTLAFFVLGKLTPAKQVFVVIDVSKSMRHYGPWQAEAAHLVETILQGRTEGFEKWALTGDQKSLNDFSTQGENKIAVLRFGSVHSAAFPFFAPPVSIDDPSKLASQFPFDAEAFGDGKTNRPLAQAVAIKLSDSGPGEVRLIVVSDFLIDSDLSAEEIAFVNDVEAHTSVETPVIFSLLANKQLQIKLMKVRLVERASTPPEGSTAIILATPELRERPRAVLFRWRVSGPFHMERFSLFVKSGNTNVFGPQNLVGNSALFESPPSGRLLWYVSGTTDSGVELRSNTASLTVPEDLTYLWLVLILLIGSGAGLLWKYRHNLWMKEGDDKQRKSDKPVREEEKGWKL